MTRFYILLARGLVVVALAGGLRAQDVTPTAVNPLWNPVPLPTGDPATAGQFGGFSSVTSSASTRSTDATPRSGNLQLRLSFLGATMAGAPPEFAIGDVIGTPRLTFSNAQGIEIALRREPVRQSDAAFKYRTAADATVRDFQPSAEILSERFFWSPHARHATQVDMSGKYEEVTAEGTPGSVLRDGFTYASEGGSSRIYWRTTSPIGVDGSNNPVYGLEERNVSVSTASRVTVRRVFWTEHGFQGPPVAVPRGEIQQVRIAYSAIMPEFVPEGTQYPAGGTATPTRRTLWHDGTLNSLQAYNREGRVLVEFLGELRAGGAGLRRQVAIEVVDVIQEAYPSAVDVPVGERIFPLPSDQTGQQPYVQALPGAGGFNAQQRIASLLAAYSPMPILNPANPPFTQTYQVAGQTAYYATRATTSSSDVQFFWGEPGAAGILWPRFLNRYRQYWPDSLTDYAVNVRPTDSAQNTGTPPVFGAGSNFQLLYQDNGAAVASNTAQFIVELNNGKPTNRSLLLVTAGESFWFVRVESVLDSHMAGNPRYASFYSDTVPVAGGSPVTRTAVVGQRLQPPDAADTLAGFVDLSRGDALDPTAYVNPFSAGFEVAESTGAIIPVNAAPKKGSKDNDKLTVWWFKKIQPPAHLVGKIAPVYFPSFHYRYQLVWPVNAPQIVLASNMGSGALTAGAAEGRIYVQNNPAQIGYNPNEEHALMLAGRAYALRDDLNHPQTSSSPYVLVRFTNSTDGRPDMRAFRVLRENESHTFTYTARAGTVLNPPMPLAIMPPPVDGQGRSLNREVTPENLDPALNPPAAGLGALEHYNRFTYKDRKGQTWIYRGQHEPSTTPPALGMKFYYATLDGFAYPNATTGVNEAPPIGTITPFLHDASLAGNNPKTGTSITISYRPYWPDASTRNGLKAEYYNNIQLSGTPVLTRLDPTVDFSWNGVSSPAPGVNPTNFSARWSGYIVIPKTGNYTFHIETDDGTRLWLGNPDADPFIDAWYEQAPADHSSVTARFSEGQRLKVKFEFFQASGGAVAKLLWEGPGIARQVIPSINLQPVDEDSIEVPSLQFAETLVKPKRGLPGLDGASSAHILYQQSVARNVSAMQESAVLHDPTRRKIFTFGVGLDRLPDSALTDNIGGRLYFQGLPAHLQQRFYFDPSLGASQPPAGGLVLEGRFHDEPVGEDRIDLNVLTAADLSAIKALIPTADSRKAAWDSAISQLKTTLQTFEPNPAVPGGYRVKPGADVEFNQSMLVRVSSSDQAVDSYALSAVGGGSGYVTLVTGDGDAFTDASEPVQMHILRVGPDLYRGQVKPVPAINPLAEDITLQHSGDFAGQSDQFEFQWYYSPPVNGQPPANRPGQSGATWLPPAEFDGPRLVLDGSQPLLVLTDNYFVMRHRPVEGHALRPVGSNWSADEGWSQWTEPALAEGWIKRVLAGINPFSQRFTDFFNNAVNTDVSLLTQAGERWEGNVSMTLDAVQNTGLITIYETVLRRGMGLTIEGTPPIDYGPGNDALLLAAGYLNDLYMALGNEAYADAANPLISLDVDPQRLLTNQGLPASIGTTIQTTASSRFAFEGQVPSLLDEELCLLRGRDDLLVPGVRNAPVYNRLFWNFTRGIDAGEVIYALNYNIQEKAGQGADGRIDANDARRQYPQGHGDAYGHYLTAVKNYYRLLANPHFTWTPRVEAVNILGVPVTVDYQDERKFAAAAVALGRTASRILDLERRKLPVGSDSGWVAMRESKKNTKTGNTRRWGMEDWASRSGQGNYLHWVTVNALLPDVDRDHEGLQKIDRTTVAELQELATLGQEIQTQLDGANRHVNALNLSDDSVLFDISPNELAAGQSHFDQILARAKRALANAAAAHERTIHQNALLRSVENQVGDYSHTVDRQEYALLNQLYEIYGMPYSGDIGPGKLYPQGYDGPDYFNYNYINRPAIYNRETVFGVGQERNWTRTFQLPIRNEDFRSLIGGFDGETGSAREIWETFRLNYQTQAPAGSGPTTISATPSAYVLRHTVNLNDGPYQFATPAMGQRPYTGSLQTSLASVLKAREDLFLLLRTMDGKRGTFDARLKRFAEDIDASNKVTFNERAIKNSNLALEKAIGGWELFASVLDALKEETYSSLDALAETLPKVVGLATDAFAPARGAVKSAGVITSGTLDKLKIASSAVIYAAKFAQDVATLQTGYINDDLKYETDVRAKIAELDAAYRDLFSTIREIDLAAQTLDAALSAYQNKVASGLTLLAERETFRKRAAAVIQGARTRDVAFRAFRTESLEQYKILFDQAARYAFLATKAYDYETGQLGTPSGRDFLAGIVSSRALGLVGANGQPQFAGSHGGDPGLSSYLAKLEADWNVAKGRLGINNPDTYGTVFSLRRELFRLPYKEDGSAEDHTAWEDRLRASVVKDLRTDPVIAAHALPMSNPTGLAQPGFVIDFPTVIETGLNFFGHPLNAGDSAYSSASFSTKIHSVGVVFKGYLGMNPGATGTTGVPPPPTHNDPNALAATPYCYLIPGGADAMRTPPINGATPILREWLVQDHAMPLPFDIGSGGFGQNTVWTSSSSLSEPFFLPRKHQPFRASDTVVLFYSPFTQDYTNRRLVGRSVWNTNWKLVIPAQSLLANPQEGIERFIRSVKDIKLFLKTYSHSGN